MQPTNNKEILRFLLLGVVLFSIIISEIAIFVLSGGLNVVIAHLFYFPVLFLAFLYPRRGIVMGTLMGLGYFVSLSILTTGDPTQVGIATIQFFVFVSVSVAVSSLSGSIMNSQEKYRNIFCRAGNCVFCIDLSSGKILEHNQICRSIFGLIRDDTTLPDLIVEWADEDAYAAFVTCLREEGQIVSRELHATTPGGSHHDILVSAGTIQDEEAVFTISDITAPKRIAEDLRKSERRFRELTDLLPQTVFEIDSKGIVTFANRAGLEQFGYTAGDLAHRHSFMDLVPPEARSRLIKNFQESLGGEPFVREYTALRKDGSTFPAIFHCSSIITNGTPVGMRGVVTDISDLRDAERALKESEFLYRTVFDSSGTGMAIVNDDATIEIVNAEFADLLGYTVSDFAGRKWTELVQPDEIDLLWNYHNLRKTDPAKVPRNYNMHFIRSDGKKLTCFATVSRIPDSDGFVVSFLDITEQRRTQDALAEASKKLNLVSSINRHDLRNQLTIMLGYMELVRDSVGDDPEQTEYCDHALSCIDPMLEMIDFTKDYQELGVKAPAWQRVETVTREALRQQSSNSIVLEVSDGECEIFADPLLSRVFYILMENSVRHGGEVTRFRVDFSEEEDCGVLTFEDNGRGIPEKDKERIFDHGFGNNTGLGLFLAREILGITNIDIRETGEEGEGVRFEMLVPMGDFHYGGSIAPPV
jgi:PAS domain S-box-containing protein